MPLVLAGPVHAQDSPEAAVEVLLDAVEALQLDAIPELVCEDYRDDARAAYDPTADFEDLPGIDASRFLDALSIDISERMIDVVDQQDGWALVHVNAVTAISIDETVAKELAALVAGLMSDEVDDASIDSLTATMVAAIETDEAISSELEVIEENGNWRVCDDIAGLLGDDGYDEPLVTDVGSAAGTAEDSLCGLISIEELNAMGPLEYVEVDDTMPPNCMYSSDVSFHSLSIGLDEFSDYDSLLQMWGAAMEVEESTVGDRRAIYIRDFGALMVDSGAGMLGVSILGGEGVMTAQEVLGYAIDVAQVVLPRYLESLP
jgi:hypothetical protein